MADDRSRVEFAAQIAWRCSLDYGVLPPPDPPGDMYFKTDIFRLSGTEALVDCGAFDGDSIRMFLGHTSGAFRVIYALEPDPANRARLRDYVLTIPEPARDRIVILPYGAGDRTGRVSFEASGTVGARMSSGGGTAIECRRLDDIAMADPPTFIKMDIEGAEPLALAGAIGTIRKARPILAVCAYHKCEHLWTLPRLIASALPDYRIFLRRYAEECWETVYYAVPPSRVAASSQATDSGSVP
jgi:FkbM family methyltransferase